MTEQHGCDTCVWHSTENTCIAPKDERLRKGCIPDTLYFVSEAQLIRLEQLGTSDCGDTEAKSICDDARCASLECFTNEIYEEMHIDPRSERKWLEGTYHMNSDWIDAIESSKSIAFGRERK
jgi:hypothetical protein